MCSYPNLPIWPWFETHCEIFAVMMFVLVQLLTQQPPFWPVSTLVIVIRQHAYCPEIKGIPGINTHLNDAFWSRCQGLGPLA